MSILLLKASGFSCKKLNKIYNLKMTQMIDFKELEFQGVPIEDLVLVRVFQSIDSLEQKGDRLVAKKFESSSLEHSNTIHFAMNGVVSNHAYGTFDGQIAIIIPLKDIIALSHKPSSLKAEDTWFHYDSHQEFSLPQSTILVCPEGTPPIENLNVTSIIEFKPGSNNEARNEAIEQVVKNLNLPVKKIGMWNWEGEGREGLSATTKEKIAKALGVRELNTNSHANSPESSAEIFLNKINSMHSSALKGELYISEQGVDMPISYLAENAIKRLQEETLVHRGKINCSNANHFFDELLVKAQSKVLAINQLTANTQREAQAGQLLDISIPPPLPLTEIEIGASVATSSFLSSKINSIRQESWGLETPLKPRAPVAHK